MAFPSPRWLASAVVVFVSAGCAPEFEESNWSAQAQDRIAAGEYAPQTDGEDFNLVNRAQDLRGRIGEQGVALSRRDGTGEVRLSFRAWGRGVAEPVEAVLPEEGKCLAGGAVDAFGECLHRLEFERPGIVEWWENRAEGLELGFTVTAPPEGDGELVFDVEVIGATVEVEGDARLIRDGDALRVSALTAWDERGRELPSWMEAFEGGLRLVVDDTNAIGVVTVDPLITAESWTAEGGQADAAFGYAVASAGDVNGDGFGDVIVGAYSYDNGETDEGRAFVYHGAAAGLATTSAWTAESDQASASFGFAVSTAGDVNGDGYGDVVVGARNWDNGSTNEGRAYVYLGSSAGLATSATWTAESDQTSAAYGFAVSSAGDVNGDGYADTLIGARYYDNGSTDEGRGYVYLGSATGPATSAAWTAEANVGSAQFGRSVSAAGDVNGDGYGDVIIGASSYANGETQEGRAFVYLGSSSGLATAAGWGAESNQATAYFGCSVGSAGDVNGDGYSDVIVGSYGYDNGESEEGRAFVYLGSSTGPATTAAWTAESGQAGAYTGWAVASAGDVNGDGYGDIVVGTENYNGGLSGEGQASVYLGGSTGLATTAAWTAESNYYAAYFGAAVASAGDVNGDGFGDVIVGAYSYTNGESNEGLAFVYLGSGSGLASSASWSAEPNQTYGEMGYSVAAAGDVNGDGFGDVVVGAHLYDNGQTDEGRAYLYLGSTSGLATSAVWTTEPDQTSAYLGYSVASAGDVNGDGYADVIVGAYRADNGETREGRAYVFHGSSAGLSTSSSWTGESDQASAYFGYSVASVGDVDGDGYGDVAVGAYGYDNGQTDEGRAYVYLGSATGLTTPASWTTESNQASAYLGALVAGAGDVNGDGFGDVAIGAYLYDNGQTDEGRISVFHGAQTGLSTIAAWTAESDQASSNFGYSAASAGDVNQDGYGDLIAGAYLYDNGATDEGRAVVYLGASGGLAASSAWSAESDQASSRMGWSVASAGDVNGDGYSDVVVGTYLYDNVETNEGRASVYLGSSTGVTTAAGWTTEANQSSARLGVSVASAGDVNGDGYADLVVGADTYTNGSSYEGAAFLYLGNGADGTTPLSLAPQARQTGLSTPISPGLSSTSTTGFDVAMSTARSPFGLGKIKLQVEAKPLGTSFDGSNLQTATTYTSSGLTGADLQQAVTGLTGSTGHHWRARVYLSPAEGRPQGWGPWVYGGLSGDAVGSHVFTAGTTFYIDADGDGYGNSATSTVSRASSVSGYVTNATDCDDASATINPSATELVADGIDQDCDSFDTCYTDADADNYGTTVVIDGSSLSCATGTGAAVATDCDDLSSTVNPAATEVVADGIDQDCDSVDSCYTDADGDNYGTTVVIDGASLTCSATVSTDCDDSTASINPAATEVVADFIDQDCDLVDSCYTDADNDEHGTTVVIDSNSLDCEAGVGALDADDCDDTDARIHPSRTETTADGIDQDCDLVDSCYTDADGDNYGTTVVTDGSSLDCATGTGAAVSTDCDDTSATVTPAASEVVNDGIDQDCDSVDSCYTDTDGDNYGTTVVTDGSSLSCTTGTGAPVSTDCDDAQSSTNPAATEVVADGTDQDCDSVDSCYTDADGDNYGTTAVTDGSSLSCATGTGAAVSTDCDDAQSSMNPAATEVVADGTDQDCDSVDSCYTDSDGDNYGTSVVTDGSSLSCSTGTGATTTTDCDDTDGSINPAETELPGDEVDQDCDGAESCYVDADGDGARTAFRVASPDLACSAPGEALATADLDCDDTDATAFPAATEVTGSGTDEDCDGSESCFVDADGDGYRPDATSTVVSADDDCADAGEALATALTGDCDDTSIDYNPGVAETDCSDPADYNCDGTSGYTDGDGDGYAACDECDDASADVYPGAAEGAGDGVDGDCDGVDTCYVDADRDGYRTTTTITGTTIACDGAGEAAASAGLDCDDADGGVHPSATETVGDELDADCDGGESCYSDADRDGYRADDGAVTTSADTDCADAGEATDLTGLDCDDGDAAVNPAGTETPGDGVDGDCDNAELCYEDVDDDGYRPDSTATVSSPDLSCSGAGTAPATAATGDCDDGDATVSPSGTEVAGDEADSDCDGTEVCFADQDDDGYRGDDGATVSSADTDCEDPTEARDSTLTGDCDDTDAAFHPGATEGDCSDPADYNCDGSAGYDDADADGWAACEECDDASSAVYPGATELPGDSVDQDCDGSELCYVDADDDGYRPDGTDTVTTTNLACDGAGEALGTDIAGDCDDDDATINPGAVELPGDELDQNCEGSELCYVDADGDGYAADDQVVDSVNLRCDDAGEATDDTPAGDCDDADIAIHPGASETDCEDPTDYDCDGSSGMSDGDGDRFGACEECDDSNAAVNPDAVELCNGIDDDCDGTIDIDAVDAETWYADADRDGYTDPDASVVACDAPDGYLAATEEDCDDADAPSHPGGDEIPGDGLDQDCDGADAAPDGDDTGAAPAKDGCGCAATPPGVWLGLAAMIALRRRREIRR